MPVLMETGPVLTVCVCKEDGGGGGGNLGMRKCALSILMRRNEGKKKIMERRGVVSCPVAVRACVCVCSTCRNIVDIEVHCLQ